MSLGGTLVVWVTVSLNIQVVVGIVCNEHTQNEAMRCIETLFPTAQRSGPGGNTMAWDYQKMKMACLDGTMSMSVLCVRSIIGRCKDNPRQLELLHKYFDTERMYNGLQRLCDQLDEARVFMPCMQTQLHGFVQCAEDKLGVFEDRTKLAGGNEDKIIVASCSFMDIVYDCQATAIREHCGEFPAELVLQTMNAFRPPSCPTSGAIERARHAALSLPLPTLFSLLYLASWLDI